jgi:hypothetical protein
MAQQIHPFKCVYINYQSLEDWTEAHIMRCNPDFHQHERYDCVIVNSDSNSQCLAVARLRALLRCTLPTGRSFDISFVCLFREHQRWRPTTLWDGCKVFGEPADCEFLLMDCVVRGALLSPAFNQKNKALHYAIDSVDADMFLRANSW